jgi:hypothetical protein
MGIESVMAFLRCLRVMPAAFEAGFRAGQETRARNAAAREALLERLKAREAERGFGDIAHDEARELTAEQWEFLRERVQRTQSPTD